MAIRCQPSPYACRSLSAHNPVAPEVLMPNRSNALRFIASCILLGASTLAAQSTSQNQLRRWLKFPPPPAGYHPLAQPAAPRIAYLPVGRFKLLDSSTGWAATSNRLLWTNDGGASWKDISPPHPNRDSYAGVFFVDQSDGWVLFSHQIEDQNDPIPHNPNSDWTFYLAATQDGGSTWTTLQIPALLEANGNNSEGGQIVFGDRLNGWILVGHSQSFADLLHSSDGGLHWEWVTDYPEIAGEIRAVGANSLFIDGIGPRGHQLYATWDAGRTFQEIRLAPPSAAGKAHYPHYDSPQFVDSQTGYETVTFNGGNDIPSATVLFKTTDRGHTWTPIRTFENLMDGDEDISSTVVDSSWLIPFKPSKGNLSLMKLPLSPGQTSAPPSHVGELGSCRLSFWGSSMGWANFGSGLSSTDDGGSTWTIINPKVNLSTGALTTAPVTPPPPPQPPLQPLATPRSQAVPRPQPPLASIASPAAATNGLPSGLSQQLAFDAYDAPSVAKMQAWWNTSPYYDVLVYLPSENHSANANLNARWVRKVYGQGWGVIPMWVGPQSLCSDQKGLGHFSSNPTAAHVEGLFQAIFASSSDQAYGFDGTVIYLDIEPYTKHVTGSCRDAVKAYLEGFIETLHRRGATVGVYADIQNIPDINNSCYGSGGYQVCAPPDDIFVARGDDAATVWNLGHGNFTQDIQDSEWPTNERSHQYWLGTTGIGHYETWGGVPLSIDNDIVDAVIVPGDPALKPLNVNSTPTTVTYPSSFTTLITAISVGANNSSNNPPFTQGNVVGSADFGFTPFEQDAGQQPQALPTPPSPSCRYPYVVYPTGINSRGTIVGYYAPPMDPPGTDPCYTSHGIIWPASGGYIPYDDLNAVDTQLLSINDAGWITGSIIDDAGNDHCILIKPDANGGYSHVTPIQFDEVGGNCSASAVNGIGLIAGNYISADGSYGAFYDDVEDGTPGDNGVPLGSVEIDAVNNNELIIGSDYISDLFGLIGYVFPSSTTIYNLNDDPEIVGAAFTGEFQEGVLYDTAH
jgi:hypothetical protein